ncbi:hypothetical protein GLOIN_2v1595045 [Rhizophagus clarus]|uniref:Uncharacterized protein n=1 Tax=Rhizophagus clarus TaxID=94130 RepID=A0A8H3L597_9GLOM|nr:hypothetical protein GLOIN_2v1595045 [Rhizophagus clarus]
MHSMQSLKFFRNCRVLARAHDECPPKDGYENDHHLNVVARAILIHPADLVLMWKEIAIMKFVTIKELVMQGALLILFPPTPPNDWDVPRPTYYRSSF